MSISFSLTDEITNIIQSKFNNDLINCTNSSVAVLNQTIANFSSNILPIIQNFTYNFNATILKCTNSSEKIDVAACYSTVS